MTKKEYQARAEFESAIRAEVPDDQVHKGLVSPRAAANLLMRHGKTYARVQEMVCNGVEWMQHDTNESFSKRQARHEAWTEKREQQLERRMRQIVQSLGEGFGVVFSGDPRGCTVKVTVPSGRTNDWGKEGICVPTA